LRGADLSRADLSISQVMEDVASLFGCTGLHDSIKTVLKTHPQLFEEPKE